MFGEAEILLVGHFHPSGGRIGRAVFHGDLAKATVAAVRAGDVGQSSKYFMALYFGGATRQERREGVLPHLHVFDWNGGFLYDIALNESIESVAFDEMDNKLYGVDSNDSVYRYDMSELL